MSRRQSAARKTSDDSGGAQIAARVMLDLGRTNGTYEFEQINVATDDPQHLQITLANADGRSIRVLLPRAELRKLLSWRMLMNL